MTCGSSMSLPPPASITMSCIRVLFIFGLSVRKCLLFGEEFHRIHPLMFKAKSTTATKISWIQILNATGQHFQLFVYSENYTDLYIKLLSYINYTDEWHKYVDVR